MVTNVRNEPDGEGERKMTMTKVFSNRELAKNANYKETAIDEAKKTNNRLVAIDGDCKTVIMSDGETIFLSGKRQWNKWSKENEYVTDF